MLEQEIASIIKFTLDAAGNPSPYYYDVPEGFTVPAVYFPSPEISTRGETFRTYAMEYAWYIKFFGHTSEVAHELALRVLVALKRGRNLVPIIGEDGNPTGEKLRIDDPEIKGADRGATILKVYWISRKLYDYPETTQMQDIHLQRTISAAYAAAIEQ